MYILFINLDNKCDIFFLLNLIIIVIKKICPTHEFNPIHVGWVGLNFFNPPWLGQKILLTRPNLTNAYP